MRSCTRSNSPRVQEPLHKDFVEIGRSGRRWTRDEVVSSLAEERDHVAVVRQTGRCGRPADTTGTGCTPGIDHSSRRASRAVLARVRTGRPRRQHCRLTRATQARHRNHDSADRGSAGTRAGATRHPAVRYGAHDQRRRAPLPATQSNRGKGASRHTASRRRRALADPPSNPSHPRIAPSPVGSKA